MHYLIQPDRFLRIIDRKNSNPLFFETITDALHLGSLGNLPYQSWPWRPYSVSERGDRETSHALVPLAETIHHSLN
jgi:hypothetical protein